MFQVIPRALPSSSAGLDNFQSSDRNCRKCSKELQLRKCPTNVPWIRSPQSVDSISQYDHLQDVKLTRNDPCENIRNRIEIDQPSI